jgi:hypothetical protein
VILAQGGNIFRAIKRYQWPNEGAAVVVVSIVHVLRAGEVRSSVLDGRHVDRISAYLVAGNLDDAPARLETNDGKALGRRRIPAVNSTMCSSSVTTLRLV